MGVAPLCQGADLTPGTIDGNVGFTNANPTVIGILNAETMTNCSIRGFSSTPPGLSASTSCGPLISSATTPPMRNYDLTVESLGGMPLLGGVTYNLLGRASLYTGLENGIYNFANQNTIFVPTLGTVSPVNFQECAGIIDFKIDNSTCLINPPPPVERLRLRTLFPGRFANKNIFQPVLQTNFIVPDIGNSYPIQYTLGNWK
jgi:hypothetical protein